MRHGKKFNHLSRTSSHRKAMFSNMASSLIKHKRIKTTLAKAKALRTFVEPLITKSKDDTTHSRRVVFSYLQDKDAVNELFREVATKISDRPGGYTRILKLGPRLGDNAEMCLIELVDYNENLLATKETKAKRTRRGRRGSKSSQSEEAPQASRETEKDVSDDVQVKPEDKAEKAEETKAAEKTEVKPVTDTPEAKTEAPEAKVSEETPRDKSEPEPGAEDNDKKQGNESKDEKENKKD